MEPAQSVDQMKFYRNCVCTAEAAPPSYVDITEPEPANRPFIWSPKSEQSQFVAYVCGECGYTEYYAVNYKALNEGRKKGFRSG